VGVKDVGVIFAADNLRNEIGHGALYVESHNTGDWVKLYINERGFEGHHCDDEDLLMSTSAY
jgi:hypothetical protein